MIILRFIVLTLAWSGLAFTGHAQAQDGEASRSPLARFEWWGPQSGLPQTTVNALAQTTDGYMWFGTFGGLVRFDGVSMKVFSVRSHPVLASDRITALLGTSDGSLWVGTQYGGVYRYRDERFEEIDLNESSFARSFSEGEDGSVWIAHGGLFRWKDGEVQQIPVEVNRPVDFVLPGEPNDVWCGSNNGLFHFDGEQTRQLSKPGIVHQILTAPEGGVWVSSDTLHLVSEGGQEREYPLLPNPGGRIRFLDSGKGGTWVSGSQGLFLWRDSDLNKLNSSTTIHLDPVIEKGVGRFRRNVRDIRTMLVDAEGSLWIGTTYNGVCRVSVNDSIEEIQIDQSLLGSLPVGGDEFYVTNGRSTIYSLNRSGDFREITLTLERDNGDVKHMFRDYEGRSWVLRSTGVILLNNGTGSRVLDEAFETGFGSRDGRVWLGSENRVSVYDGTKLVHHPLNIAERDFVLPVAEQEDGSLWLIDSRNLYSFNGSEIEETYPLPDSISVRIRAHELDSDGTLWLSSYGQGLYRFKDGRFDSVDSSRGLSDDYLGHIFAEADGNLWINSNRGVFAVSIEDLNQVIDSDLNRVECRVMGTPEGNGGQGIRDDDGQMWFPTVRGLVGVRMNTAKNDLAPPIFIDSIRSDGEFIDGGELATSPPGDGNLELSFSVLSYIDPSHIHAKYRLLGLSDEWVDIGSRRTVYFTNLDPGQYEFELSARNSDGVWNLEGARQSIYLEPHYYQTWWFYCLSGGLVVVLAIGFHNQRVRRIEKHNRELNQEMRSRRSTELALRESEASYRAVAETAMDGIVVVNRTMQVAYANEAAERMFGIDFDDVESRDVDSLLVRSPLEDDREAPMLELSHLESDESIELVGRHSSGREFPVELSSGRLERPDAEDALVCIIRDVTNRRSLERQLADRNRLEAIGKLTGGIAHDFNNILTAMVGYVEMLEEDIEDGLSNELLKEHLLQIHLSNERAANLVRDLMTFARQRVVKRRSLEPNGVIEDLVPMLQRLIPVNIALDFKLDETAGCILIDSHQLEQIVVNLVLNGKDAIEGQGTVTISTWADASGEVPQVVISVADDGCGMSKEGLSKIFDPFFTTKPVGKGTGLGLASVHGIVKQSGGSIDVKSSLGSGTEFTVYFPSVSPIGGKTEAPVPAIPVSKGSDTVLLCDDFLGARVVASKALSRWGYTVLEADTPEEALQLSAAHEGTIDALVTDVVMPNMNGPALAGQVREQWPHIKVLYISGYVADLSIESELNENDAFLEKPFSPSDLLAALRKLMDASSVSS